MPDEAGVEMKARPWVPITKLQIAPQVVMVGDRNQLGPLQLSKGANINEFGLLMVYMTGFFSTYDRPTRFIIISLHGDFPPPPS